MATLRHPTPSLLADGEKLSREEFLRRWEMMPDLKFAELLEGEVYLASPLGYPHGIVDGVGIYWIEHYAFSTPGCIALVNTTWLMLKDSPQPDVALTIRPDHGGQSSVEGNLASSAPELIVEVSDSSKVRDLGPKLRLYRSAGVREYINVFIKERKVLWQRLIEGEYGVLPPDDDGIMRSALFPGLWLDADALLNLDGLRILVVLNEGLRSPEHAAFAEALALRAPRP